MPWTPLSSKETLAGIFTDNAPHIIFKHSPRCGISAMVLRRFERSNIFKNSNEKFWLLHVIENREISNALATDLNVIHESPQILVIYQGECLHHAAHSEIDANQIETSINGIK